MLSKDYSQVTQMTGQLLISVHVLEHCPNLQSIWKWDMGIDNNLDNMTSYTMQYQMAFLKYAENEYFAKQW
jgi:hypothetical protein